MSDGQCSIRNCEKELHIKTLKLCRYHHYHVKAWGLDKNGESKQPKCLLCNKIVQPLKKTPPKKLAKQISEVLVKNTFEKHIIGNRRSKLVLFKRVCNKCYPKYLRNKITKRLGSICKCCGENEPLFIQIDHINGGGAKDRKKFSNIGHGMSAYYEYLLTHPDLNKKYQLLCANCNIGRYRNGEGHNNGVCPHQTQYRKCG